nr:response regulator transcription factor [uncultured Mogibacterium sp.]
MKILVVEDDQNIREGVAGFLSEFGYTVIEAADGREALDRFKEYDISLAILDIKMPYLSGLEVLKEIRKGSKLPVLMLTAFSDEEYKIDAYTNMADGYLEKPFSLPVLRARVDSLIERYYGVADKFMYRDAEVDFASYTAKLAGKSIDINAKEVDILKFMFQNAGRALTREQIIDGVWKATEEPPFDRVIDVYIKELRRKLELDCIVTIRNVGYKLERR